MGDKEYINGERDEMVRFLEFCRVKGCNLDKNPIEGVWIEFYAERYKLGERTFNYSEDFNNDLSKRLEDAKKSII